MDKLPEDLRPAFFEMVGYPMMASYQMNRKFLLAQVNHEQAQAGHVAEANWAAKQAQMAFDSIASLNMRYNTLLDGKWAGGELCGRSRREACGLVAAGGSEQAGGLCRG